MTLDGPRPGAKENEPVGFPVEGIVVAEEGALHRKGLELGVWLRHHPPDPRPAARGELRFERIAARDDEMPRDPHPPFGVATGGPANGPAGAVREDHHRPAGLAKGFHRVHDAGHRFGPHVDYAVAVEDERVVAPGERGEPRRRLAPTPAGRGRKPRVRETAQDRLRLEFSRFREGGRCHRPVSRR